MKTKGAQWRRRMRVRMKVRGTRLRPRLSVFRSLRHIYAQLVDDAAGNILAAASTLSPSLREKVAEAPPKEAAKTVGILIAELARSKGIGEVVFDRNIYRYHGRVRALAEGAREGGLKF